jgi:DNA polymerase IV
VKNRQVACIWFPHFRAQIALAGAEKPPLIVHHQGNVLDACTDATACGVAPGMSLSHAQALCPLASAVSVSHDEHIAIWERVLDALALHSPGVESEEIGAAYLEAGGMARMYGRPESWCEQLHAEVQTVLPAPSRLGIAGSKFAALVAAHLAADDPGYLNVSERDRDFLSPLSAGWLPLPEETRRQLRVLGINTLGHFARLSATSVIEQFGPGCTVWHQWARGEDNRPLQGRERESVEASQEFDAPVNQLDILIVAGEALVEKLLPVLTRSGLIAWRMEVQLQMAEGATWRQTIPLREPLSAARLPLLLSELLADWHIESAGVAELRLCLTGLKPAVGEQLELFAHLERNVNLEDALRRLATQHVPHTLYLARPAKPHAPLLAERYLLVEYAHDAFLAGR